MRQFGAGCFSRAVNVTCAQARKRRSDARIRVIPGSQYSVRPLYGDVTTAAKCFCARKYDVRLSPTRLQCERALQRGDPATIAAPEASNAEPVCVAGIGSFGE